MRKRLLSLLFAGIFTASSLAQGFPVLAEDQLMTESPAVGMTEQAAQLEQTLQAEQTSDQGGLQKLQTVLFSCHYFFRRYIFMTDFETELLQARHRLEEAQARNRVKDCKSRTRMLIQKINSGNGNIADNADNDEIVGELFMGSIQTNTMVSMKYWRKRI